MAVLADLERLLERVFERSTARLFRAHPQAVQLERRVERAMERARATTGGRTSVPARYRVRLHPEDLADVAAASGGPEELAGRLADAALAFARGHAYHLTGRPSVALVADPAVQLGVIEVDPVIVAARPEAAAQAPHVLARTPTPVPDMPVVGPRSSSAPPTDTPAASTPAPVAPAPRPDPSPAPATASPAAVPTSLPLAAAIPALGTVTLDDVPHAAPATGSGATSGGIRGDGTGTLVFRKPAPAPTRAVLRVIAKDGSERTVEVDGTPLTLGRAADNGLVLADPRVSRHHARLQSRRGTLVFTDLGSTNGSRLNGVRVDECALGTGDRVVLGDTVLLVEQLPG